MPTREQRFTQLFDAHVPSVRRYFRRRCHPNDVEDLVAETFTVAWRRLDELPDGFELAWLYRTAGYLLANHRRKTVEDPTDSSDMRSTPSAEDVVVADLSVASALARLSAEDREVLRLHVWEGLSGAALAESLATTPNTAAQRLSRAKARFAEHLAGELSSQGGEGQRQRRADEQGRV